MKLKVGKEYVVYRCERVITNACGCSLTYIDDAIFAFTLDGVGTANIYGTRWDGPGRCKFDFYFPKEELDKLYFILGDV